MLFVTYINNYVKSFCLLGVLSITFIYSCSNGDGIEEDKNGNIVLIFKKNPLTNEGKEGIFFTRNHIRYYDSTLIRQEININNKKQNDTLVIENKKSTVPMDLFHNYIVFNYVFSGGDTVVFDYVEDVPQVTIQNGEDKKLDLNYSLVEKRHFGESLKANNILTFGRVNKTDEEILNENLSRYLKKLQYLDSLQKAGELSKTIADFHRKRIEYDFAGKILNGKMEKIYEKKFGKTLDLTKLVNEKDLLGYDFFHTFLKYAYLSSETLNIPKIKHAHGISIDYKMAYDKVRTSVSNDQVKDYLSFYCLNMIYEEDGVDEFINYLTKFKEDVQDSTYSGYLSRNYSDLTSHNQAVMVDMSRNKKLNFDEFIRTQKGKVVYVDIWASWCMPCRAAMPSSHKLRVIYKDKPVEFVYLSIDKVFDSWQKAFEEEGLTDYKSNYLLLQPATSPFIKDMNIRTIPRYLLYDKNGNLKYPNAPGPNSEAIVKLIERQL